MNPLPTLYFRRKGAGAGVYRIDHSQNTRLNLQQIAVLKPNGEIKTHGKHTVTLAENTEITNWYKARALDAHTRDNMRIDTLVSDINAAAQWLQADASDAHVSKNAETILMAMHDLRSTLVRRMTNRDTGEQND